MKRATRPIVDVHLDPDPIRRDRRYGGRSYVVGQLDANPVGIYPNKSRRYRLHAGRRSWPTILPYTSHTMFEIATSCGGF
ncbi:hypothetical protein PIB30_050702 [Stylosanthes scabra]|uniref:Uncharacterized protein n=1 Tax=Stylosanthes scabra TaxID=79078 RepID=A0ABU6UHH8_9FABA|nr:hypothetical protein [Stylosanthes scabra]